MVETNSIYLNYQNPNRIKTKMQYKENTMARILVVGAGNIGGMFAEELAQAGNEVWGIRRSEKIRRQRRA